MATELPFYKFEVLAYLTGDICLESWELQGIFNNICAFYWSKNCEVSFKVLNKKYEGSQHLIQELIDLDILKVDGDYLSINFLNEQWASKETQKIVNTINGKKGGRPRKENPIETEKKPNGFNFANRNETNIDKRIIDNNREDEIRQEDSFFLKSSNDQLIDDLLQSDFEAKKSELISALVDHFDFNAPQWGQKRSHIMQFVNSQMLCIEDIDHFKNQFVSYIEFKKLSKQQPHNFTGYLGTPAMRFENAGWNAENWSEKLAKFKSNPNNLTKAERTIQSYHEAKNPYE